MSLLEQLISYIIWVYISCSQSQSLSACVLEIEKQNSDYFNDNKGHSGSTERDVFYLSKLLTDVSKHTSRNSLHTWQEPVVTVDSCYYKKLNFAI